MDPDAEPSRAIRYVRRRPAAASQHEWSLSAEILCWSEASVGRDRGCGLFVDGVDDLGVDDPTQACGSYPEVGIPELPLNEWRVDPSRDISIARACPSWRGATRRRNTGNLGDVAYLHVGPGGCARAPPGRGTEHEERRAYITVASSGGGSSTSFATRHGSRVASPGWYTVSSMSVSDVLVTMPQGHSE